MFKVFVLVLTLLVLCHARTSEKLKVQLPDGSRIVGRYLTSLTGRGIRSFLGVPYAEPPINDLRFKVSSNKKFRIIFLSLKENAV